MEQLFDGYAPAAVLKEHFSHLFCGESCAHDWLFDGNYGEDDDGNNLPNIDALQNLFAETPHNVNECAQCSETLTYNNSQGGYGLALDYEQQSRHYKRVVMWRGEIPDDGVFIRGYTGGWKGGETGVGIWMPSEQRRQNDGQKYKDKEQKVAYNDQKTGKTFDKIKQIASDDGAEIAKRVKAKQLTRLAAGGLAKTIAKGDSKGAKMVAHFLEESTAGKALVGLLLSAGTEMLPDNMKTEAFQAFMREVRLGPMADAADELADAVIGPIRTIALDFMASGPALDAGSQAPSLPAQADKQAPKIEAPAQAAVPPPVVEAQAEPVRQRRKSGDKGRRKTDNNSIKVTPVNGSANGHANNVS